MGTASKAFTPARASNLRQAHGRRQLLPDAPRNGTETRPLLGGHPLHLVSDLDGTWIPKAGQSPGLRDLEAFLDRCPGVTLTFATGRSLVSALALLEASGCRMPHHLVTDMGTALYHPDSGGVWHEDVDFAAWVAERWNPETREKLRQAGLPEGVEFQKGLNPPRRLALAASDPRDLEGASAVLQLTLATLGLFADVLPSGEKCIDVLPCGVDKGSPIRFMERQGRVPRPLVACGDSKNDLGLFRVADVVILMADSRLDPRRISLTHGFAVRALKPGPEGIRERLQAWWTGSTTRPLNPGEHHV